MHQRTLKNIRREWLVRLKGRDLYCALCGCLIEARKDLSADHIEPRSKNGPTTAENLAPAHKWCNQAKGDKSMADWEKTGYAYLERLVRSWKQNGTSYNSAKVYKCIKTLKSRQL